MEAPDAALRLLGLSARAGVVLPGTERVREAARAGALHLVLVAGDASANSQDKLLPMLKGREVPHAVAYDRERLGAAIGRSPLSAVGILDAALAARLSELLPGGTTASDEGTAGK